MWWILLIAAGFFALYGIVSFFSDLELLFLEDRCMPQNILLCAAEESCAELAARRARRLAERIGCEAVVVTQAPEEMRARLSEDGVHCILPEEAAQLCARLHQESTA